MKSYNIQTNRKYSKCKPHRINDKNLILRITPQSLTQPCRRQCTKNTKNGKKCNINPKLRQENYIHSDKESHLLTHGIKYEQDAIRECIKDQSTLLADLITDDIELSEKKCNSILEIINSINTSMQDKIDYVNGDKSICEKQMLKLLTKVNVQKLTINVKDVHNIMSQNEPCEKRMAPCKAPCDKRMSPCKEPCEKRTSPCKAPFENCMSLEHRHFTIKIKKRHLFYNLSVCDIDTFSMTLFQKLAYFYIKSCLILNARQKNQLLPTNTIRAWYIRDQIQGFRLLIILKFNNASTIHYMRNLFFVILTSLNLRLTIEINFEFSNGRYKKRSVSPPPTPFENIPFKIIHWNNGHRNALMTCSRIFHTTAPFCIQAGCDGTRTAVSESILHNNTNLSDSITTHEKNFEDFLEEIVDDSKFKSEIGLLESRNKINYPNLALNGSQSIVPLSVKNTDSYTNLALYESRRIMPSSVGDIFLYAEKHIRKFNDCGELLLPSKQIYRIRYSALQQRTWMSKMYKGSAKWKNEVVKPYLDSVINESVFETVEISIEKFLKNLSTYFAQFLVNEYFSTFKFDSRLFYKTFLSYFGYY